MFQSKMIDIQIPMPWFYALMFFFIMIGYSCFLIFAVPMHVSQYVFDTYDYPDANGIFALFAGQLVLFGLLLAIGQKSDTTIRENIRRIREEAPPRDARIRLDAGGVELESFWRGAYTSRPSCDDLGWVFEPPGRAEWMRDSTSFEPDVSGIIQEHPSVVGTPTPPDFTTNGIMLIMSALPLFGIGLTVPFLTNSDPKSAFLVIPALFALFAAVSHLGNASGRASITHVTQKVRSIAVGDAEVVGQVRELGEIPTVVVDNDPSKTADELPAWRWLYDVEIEETYTDSEGNTKTRRYWRTIDSDSGDVSFIVHDGTGGMVVESATFNRKSFGQPIMTWTCSHVSFSQLRNLTLWKTLRTYGSGQVLRHRWRLWGISLGDPCMIHGRAKQISTDKRAVYGISRQDPPCSRICIEGEDSQSMKARIWRGTELTNLSLVESAFETTVLPVGMTILASTISLFLYLVS